MNWTDTIDKQNSSMPANIESFVDGQISFIENIHEFDQRVPIQLDMFIVSLCLRGTGNVNIDGHTYEIHPNDLLVCHPNIILEKSSISLDFECRTICCSREYIQQLSIIDSESNTWDTLMFLERSPVLALTPEEASCFCQYYDLIHQKASGTPRRHHRELVGALMLAFLYDFYDSLDRFRSLRPQTFSASEKMFRDFLNLLSNTKPRVRSVSYYADKLYITPKYLSSVCKTVSGHTASALINHYMVRDIVFLLKNPSKSIKEICCELDFPNLSFFGRYVRKHLGMSPKQWRAKNTSNHTDGNLHSTRPDNERS